MIRFECSLPNEEDARQVFEWRNDPVTRGMSFHSEEKSWDSFFNEYMTRMFSVAALPPLFIVAEGQRAGHIFFDRAEYPGSPHLNACSISINIAPDKRGKGYGTQALQAINPWIERQGFDAVVAEIKTENAASHKSFRAAGYKQVEDRENYQVYVSLLKPETKSRPLFVIAEAGSNWHVGDDPLKNEEQAYGLIDAAAEAGADAVKFQVFRAAATYAKGAGLPNYLAAETGSIESLFETLAMPYDMIPKLAKRCDEKGIEFMASAFSLDDFNAIDPYVHKHKIASYEITFTHLLVAAARSGKPTILSTGAANSADIDWAVATFKEHGGKELTLMQCTACYPAEPESVNVKALSWLSQRYRVPVGLSDHSIDPHAAPAAALALGATVIEKHFTLDRSLPGPDHAFAVTPDELAEMIDLLRAEEAMLGSGAKSVHLLEEELRSFAQRRIQATQEIEAGDTLQEGINIAILRPGTQPSGMHPKELEQINGIKAPRSFKAGEGITL